MSDKLLLSPGTRKLIEAGAGSDHDEAYDQALQHGFEQPLPHEHVETAVDAHFQAHDVAVQALASPEWNLKHQSGGRKPVEKF